jgi:hypothetical protein
MIFFCVTECLGSFKVAAKNLQPAFQNCRQTLFITGKCYLLQANAIYCRQMLFIAGNYYLLQANAIYCRQTLFIAGKCFFAGT